MWHPPRRRQQGFTFLELVVVLAVLGVLLAIGMPRLEGLVPKYRLRSAMRRLGSTLELARVAAISRERWTGIHYVLDPGSDTEPPYYQFIPPAPDDDPYQALEDREFHSRQALPVGVRFARIILGANQPVERGSINILFSPAGNAGSHAVVLEGPNERFVSLKFNCITGIMNYAEGPQAGDVAFEHFED